MLAFGAWVLVPSGLLRATTEQARHETVPERSPLRTLTEVRPYTLHCSRFSPIHHNREPSPFGPPTKTLFTVSDQEQIVSGYLSQRYCDPHVFQIAYIWRLLAPAPI